MKYQSELINEILEVRGHEKSSLHYESECAETWIEEAKGGYPKLCDYESEWLNYISTLDDTGGSEDPEPPVGEFPYETITDVTEATVDNVVPYAYKSAVLKGKTDENLQSVRMPVLTTTGKNLLSSSFQLGWINTSNGSISSSTDKIASIELIKVLPATEYAITRGSGTRAIIAEFDDDGNYLGFISRDVFTTKNNTTKIRIFIDGTTELIGHSLTVGANNKVTYEPYKSNILTVNEDVTLCGIGDVHDTLDCLTGEVTERIGEFVLNGSEKWSGPFSGGATVEGMYYYTYEDTRIKRNTTTNVLTTISYGGFASIPFNSVWKLEQEGISSSNSTGLGLRLATKIASAAELKSYLQKNPTTVKYQLATESIKTVDLLVQNQDGKTLSVIKPIEGKMHLSTSSDTIKPLFSGEIPVEAITQNLASFIDLEMEE